MLNPHPAALINSSGATENTFFRGQLCCIVCVCVCVPVDTLAKRFSEVPLGVNPWSLLQKHFGHLKPISCSFIIDLLVYVHHKW